MSAFDDTFDWVIGVEKGYTVDAGGPTMYGITEAVARANGYQGDMQDLPLDTAKAIAKSQYWDRFHCDDLDPHIGAQVFDVAYNGGHPVQWLQAAVGVAQDGVMGPQTLAALQAADVRNVLDLFLAARLEYWTDCVNWPEDGKGWTRRGARCLRKVAGD